MDGGLIQVRFDHSNKFDLSFTAYNGGTYEVRTRPWSRYVPTYIQPQAVDESLRQIDTLGLQWFHDRTIEEHRNETGTNFPEIINLRVRVEWDDYEIYQGLTLQMSYSYKNSESRNSVFTTVFQPNGTLLSRVLANIP